jgi:hypothetical protein
MDAMHPHEPQSGFPVAAHRLGGIIPVGAIFKASVRIGQIGQARSEPVGGLAVEEALRVLP